MILDFFKNLKKEANDTAILLNNTDLFNGNIINSKIDKDILHQLNAGYTSGGTSNLEYKNAISLLAKSYNEATDEANAFKMVQDGLSESTIRNTLEFKGLTKEQINTAMSTKVMDELTKQSSVSTETNTVATWKNITAKKALAVATNICKTALMSLGTALLSMAISKGIELFVEFTDTLHQTREELKETANEIRDTYGTVAKEVSSDLKMIYSVKDEFEELSRGVSTYGENISLTADEYSRYKEIVENIISTNPSLIEGYNSEGEAIANKNTLLETSIALLKEQQRLELNRYTSDDSIKTLGKDAVQDIKDYKKENPNPYGDALVNFQNAFAKAAIRYGEDSGFAPNMIYTEFGLDPRSTNIYGTGKSGAKDFAEDYFTQIVADLRSGSSILKEYFNKSEIDELLNFAKQYDENIVKYNKDIERYSKELNPTLQLVAQAENGYENLSDIQKSFISSYVNSLKITENMTEEEIIAMADKVRDFVNTVENGTFDALTNEKDGAFTNMLDYQNQFDNGIITLEEYKNKLSEFLKILKDTKGLSKDAKNIILTLFNIETNDDGTTTSNVDEMVKQIKNEFPFLTDGQIGSLTLSELQFALKLDVTQDSIESWDQLLQKLKEFKTETDKLDTRTSMISALNNMSEGFEELDKIYSSIKDDDPFDFKLLDDKAFKEAFSGLDSYADFIEQITDNSDDIDACQAAFNNLVTEWIKSTKVLENVTDENKNLTVSMLKQMGVANADVVVTEALAIKKGTLANKERELAAETEFLTARQQGLITTSKTLAEAEYEDIVAFYNLSSASEGTRQYIARLALEKLNLQNTKINTQNEINQIIALANAAGTSTEYVNALKRALNNLSGFASNSNISAYKVLSTEKRNEYLSESGSSYLNAGAQLALTIEKNQAQKAAQDALNDALANIENTKLNASDFYAPVNYTGGSKSNSDSGGSGGSDTKTEETFDYIEIKISRIEREIDNLGKTADATYKSWSERNKALANEMSKVTDEIKVQQQAYDYYMQMANSVGLSSTYKELVQNGAIKIETLTDEALIKKIQDYKEWYEKALEAKDATQDLQDQLAELAKTKFDNVVQQFENILSTIEHSISLIEGSIDKIEIEGYLVNAKMYQDLKTQQEQELATRQQELIDLKAALDTALAEGNIEIYSDDWYELIGNVQDVESEILSLNTSIAETNNLIRETSWNIFDKMQEMLSGVQTEGDWLIDLMSNDKMFDEDTAKITDKGQATLGLHAVNYNAYMSQAEDYAKEIEKINKEIAEDPYNTILLDRREELLEQQREMISSAEAERQAIRSLAEDGYNTFLDVMDKAIEKRKELLQTTEDLLSYEREVEEQAKNIASLEKQMEAMKLDTSESAKATVQQLKVSLEEAKQTLEDTEREKYISDQEKMLDNFRDSTQQWVNERLDNLDLLLQGAIDSTNENAGTIKETLESVTEKVGTTLSEEMNMIWSSNGDFASIVTTYGDGFNSALTTTNNTLNDIRNYLKKMAGESDEAENENTNNSTSEPEIEIPKEDVSVVPETPKQEEPKQETQTTNDNISVGGYINAGSAKIYDYAGDTSGERQYYRNDPKYLVLAEKDGYLKVRHHKLSSGTSGWFKKSDVKAYKTGGLLDETGIFWGDGTKSKPELVLNAKDTENFIELKDVLRKIDSKDLLMGEENISSLHDSINILNPFNGLYNTMCKVPQVLPRSAFEQNVTIQIGDIQMHGINDPKAFAVQLKHELQTNKNIKNIIQADTLGIMTGKNGLSKFKY